MFLDLKHKNLISTEVSKSTQNYGQLQDWPTQDSYLNSIPQSLGRTSGKLTEGRDRPQKFDECAASS